MPLGAWEFRRARMVSGVQLSSPKFEHGGVHGLGMECPTTTWHPSQPRRQSLYKRIKCTYSYSFGLPPRDRGSRRAGWRQGRDCGRSRAVGCREGRQVCSRLRAASRAGCVAPAGCVCVHHGLQSRWTCMGGSSDVLGMECPPTTWHPIQPRRQSQSTSELSFRSHLGSRTSAAF